MKLFAAVLALALFAGCHGRRLPQADPKSAWEAAVDRVKDYFTALGEKVDELMKGLKRSQITRELDRLIQDSMDELSKYKDDIVNKLAPYAKRAAENAGVDLQRLYDKLLQHMEEGKEQMEKYREELQEMVQQNTEDVKSRVLAYVRKLKKRLQKDTQEIQRQATDYFEDIQMSAAEQMDGMKSKVVPFFTNMYKNAEAKVVSLVDLLKDQTSEMKYKLQDAVEDFKDSLGDTTENLWDTLGQKMKELQKWFKPLVSLFTGEE